ncbi:MAG: hypothetical protein HOF74_04110 [Gammaproteobacteria bacterium]|jgi:hypothetical protein|nr:hypothetical protein [Gammaproteobacteria bacterium]MBT3858991.1 hypothetical protein [Gammaproteobacteria bacterium]MBT3988057.1 hypothetical protein [Gammaproteobacteria bacterium]MBT4583438.1 hypothetical protein [Gammaproteobacteria bacterium]MBT4658785.1 hypothetical protein [Gammaproteobacteria bacterium]
MAEVSIDIDKEREFATITIKGDVEAGDLDAVLEKYFGNSPCMATIYDSSEGSWSNLSTDFFRRMVDKSKPLSRKGAKTAMVFSNQVNFGIGRMIESNCDLAGYENEIECFYRLEDAREWVCNRS